MAIFELSYFSRVLEKKKRLLISYPFEDNQNLEDMKVLLYLHGLSDDNSDFFQNYGIKSYSDKYNTLIISVDADRSWYTNMLHGYKYYDYVANEVLSDVEKLLNLDFKNRRVIIGGISMGGYGALKIGLKNQDIFDGIFAISPAVDIEKLHEERVFDKSEFYNIFGSEIKSSEVVFNYLDDIKIPIFTCCGEDDFLIEGNRKFHTLVDPKYVETLIDTGTHDWEYFNKHLTMGIEKLLK